MFLMIRRLWTVFSQVCSSNFHNPHRRFCVDLIVMINSLGMRQPDKVYLAILASWTSVPSNPFFCLLMTCLWLMFLIQYLELSFSTWIRVEREMEVEREKVERFCERVSVWMCVCAGSLSDSHEMPRPNLLAFSVVWPQNRSTTFDPVTH